MELSTDAKVGIGITALTLVIILGAAFLASRKSVSPDGPVAQEVSEPGKLVRQNGMTPVYGKENPKVTFVEFADFQCPSCGAFYPIVSALKDTYKDQPVQFVFRHFPLTQIHEHAQLSAEAAEAAHAQGKFWEYHNLLMENQPKLERTDLEKYAEQVGLDMNAFRSALDSHQYANVVSSDAADGRALGVQGTPTIYINNREYVGDRSAEAIQAYIDSLLNEQPAS